ncbi:MAG: CsoR family transcriptional regulator [Bacillota bacterium]|nr:CsoR family transcriptional regulator [Bacillota bacterium]
MVESRIQDHLKAHLHNHNHAHEHENGHDHTHENDHTNTPKHTHTHTHHNTKAVLNRLSRAIGHMEAVKRMVEDGKDCSEVLIQLSAVIAALNSTGKVILSDHISHCIVDAVETGDKKAIENLNIAISRFIK